MIRLVTLDSYEPKQIERLTKILYAAFGVGCEHVQRSGPPGHEAIDAEYFLANPPRVPSYEDDRLLFLTARKLEDRELPSGKAPTLGFSRYGDGRAIISSAVVKDLESGLKTVGRHALHHLGHLWELHHCLDPRCAMYPPWTPSFNAAEPLFCTFCRDKSEQKIRLAKS